MSEAVQPHGDIVVFFREQNGAQFFYPVQLMGDKPAADEVPDQVVLNPGTLRVETISGEVLWPTAGDIN